MIKVKCQNCSREFTTYNSRIKDGKGKFCSKKCFNLYHTKECICKNCGKKYRNPISQDGDKYCSRKCYLASEEFREFHKKIGKKYLKREILKCQYCGKEMQVQPSRIKNGRGKYCSLACRNLGYSLPEEVKKEKSRQRVREYREKNHDWYIAIKQKRRALQNGFGGEFTKEQWQNLKKTFNYTCPICKRKEPEITLTVDHIIPLVKWKKFTEKNIVSYKWNDIENIQPLCGSCNSKKWSKIAIKT